MNKPLLFVLSAPKPCCYWGQERFEPDQIVAVDVMIVAVDDDYMQPLIPLIDSRLHLSALPSALKILNSSSLILATEFDLYCHTISQTPLDVWAIRLSLFHLCNLSDNAFNCSLK